MNTSDFLARLPTLWDGDPQTADHPRDRKFLHVIEATRGMATENKLALLNLAAQCLERDEIYVEVGAWAGCSIIGASLGQDTKRFVTIDDFSEFGGPLDECRRNLEAFGASDVRLINGDFRQVLSSVAFPGSIGVYFYDGGHKFDDQYRALSVIEPLLADEALVVIDDTAWANVAAANRLYVERRPQFALALRFTSSCNREPRWWNGVEVYVFRRGLGPGQPPRRSSVVLTRTRLRASYLATHPVQFVRGVARKD